jgi:ketosteroid isomerase-like protein
MCRPLVIVPDLDVVEVDVRGVEASGTPYRLSYAHVRRGRAAAALRTHSPDDERNKSLVRRFVAMCNGGDLEGLAEVIAAGYVDRAHPEILGPSGVADATRRYLSANPGARVAIDTLVAEGPLVSARTTLRGTRDGEALVASGMTFFRVDDGKLAEQWSYYPRSGVAARALAASFCFAPRLAAR